MQAIVIEIDTSRIRTRYLLSVDHSSHHAIEDWQLNTWQPSKVQVGTVGELRYIEHASGSCWQFTPEVKHERA